MKKKYGDYLIYFLVGLGVLAIILIILKTLGVM